MISPLLANASTMSSISAEPRFNARGRGPDIVPMRNPYRLQHFRRVSDAMRERLRSFRRRCTGQDPPDRVGRHAAQNRESATPKPRPSFLGFVLICGKSRRGTSIRRGGRHATTACARSYGRSRKGCGCDGTCRSRTPGNGSAKSSPAISPTTPCRRTARRSAHSATTSPFSGTGVSAGAVRRHGWCGRGWRSWPMTFSPSHGSFIPGRMCASPSDTRGRSRVPELGPLGSVRQANGQ